MNRINRLHSQLSAARVGAPGASSDAHGVPPPLDVFLSPASDASGISRATYDAVLTPAAVAFVADMAAAFRLDVTQILHTRSARRQQVEQHGYRPDFLEETREIREDETWTVDWVPEALHDRRVDIGDVSPAETELLLRALNSGAQGVQVDLDDGHCPTWTNTLRGHKNMMDAGRGCLRLPSAGLEMSKSPALLLVRPRAWNMDEPNMLVNGEVVPGAIFDFALHLFHNGRILADKGTGPFLYLPKLESYREAMLWARIFVYTEKRLGFPRGTIKATVLIENIFAAFEMDEIVYALRHHSGGLNCGMWDYTASLVVNFRHAREFVLPDRQRHVSMNSPFLRHYMEMLIDTCKRRVAPATTGMVSFVLSQLPPGVSKADAIEKAKAAKRLEALAGSDGALVYDLELVQPIQQVFSEIKAQRETQSSRGYSASLTDKEACRATLLSVPSGQVTRRSVATNLRVVLAYVLAWFAGKGTAVVDGCVEDSATAEISRGQLWQWVHHQTPITEETGGSSTPVTAQLVCEMLDELVTAAEFQQRHPSAWLTAARSLVMQLATSRTPPTFITTFLLEQHALTDSLTRQATQ